MKMSEITAAKQLLGQRQAATRERSTTSTTSWGGGSTSVRYGEVTAVNADGTYAVTLDDTGEAVNLRSDQALAVGDRVKVVVQGGQYVVYTLAAVERKLDEVDGTLDDYDKNFAEYSQKMATLETEIAEMPGTVTSAVEQAIAQGTLPTGNRIYVTTGSTPTGTFKTGDMWYVYQTKTVSGTTQYQLTSVKIRSSSGSWVPYSIVANSLLVAGSAGNTVIADGAVTTDKIVFNSAFANEVNALDIYAKRLVAASGTGYAQVANNMLSIYNQTYGSSLKIGISDSDGSASFSTSASSGAGFELNTNGQGTGMPSFDLLTMGSQRLSIYTSGYNVYMRSYGRAFSIKGVSGWPFSLSDGDASLVFNNGNASLDAATANINATTANINATTCNLKANTVTVGTAGFYATKWYRLFNNASGTNAQITLGKSLVVDDLLFVTWLDNGGRYHGNLFHYYSSGQYQFLGASKGALVCNLMFSVTSTAISGITATEYNASSDEQSTVTSKITSVYVLRY